jgi:hypothetical protein
MSIAAVGNCNVHCATFLEIFQNEYITDSLFYAYSPFFSASFLTSLQNHSGLLSCWTLPIIRYSERTNAAFRCFRNVVFPQQVMDEIQELSNPKCNYAIVRTL